MLVQFHFVELMCVSNKDKIQEALSTKLFLYSKMLFTFSLCFDLPIYDQAKNKH